MQLVASPLLLQVDDVTDSVRFLERRMATASTEPYTLALIAYALQLAKSAEAGRAWRMLQMLRRSTTEPEHDYWTQQVEMMTTPMESNYRTNHSQSPLDVEMTAYALLTQIDRGELA